MLSDTERRVVDTHARVAGTRDGFEDGQRVRQWPGAHSVYTRSTGRLWVHNDTPRKQSFQELYFHSVDSVCNTLTCSHTVKFWDLRRHATPRETLRIQGFPDSFVAPTAKVVRLVGNAVCVPVARHACSCIVARREAVAHVDVCAGIGGFSVAMRQACPRTRCVGFSEVDPAATRCFQDNVPHAPALGDAERAAWPPCDVLTAGFPCQPFSSAQTNYGMDVHGARDFFHLVLRAIRRTGAQRIVLENVSTLLTVGKLRFDRMIRSLRAMGFVTQHAVLDAAVFGVPQSRKRLFVVGRRDGGKMHDLNSYVRQDPVPLGAILEDPICPKGAGRRERGSSRRPPPPLRAPTPLRAPSLRAPTPLRAPALLRAQAAAGNGRRRLRRVDA
jgi:site-specific DNA-cytosine methylase